MNRPIKFRVWDNVDYMSNPFTMQDLQDKKTQFTNDCIVMQFTGLLDNDGAEIFEGDIVRRRNRSSTNLSDNEPKIGTILYDKDSASFFMNHIDKRYSELDATTWIEGESYDERISVIGNIYENPEQLNTPA